MNLKLAGGSKQGDSTVNQMTPPNQPDDTGQQAEPEFKRKRTRQPGTWLQFRLAISSCPNAESQQGSAFPRPRAKLPLFPQHHKRIFRMPFSCAAAPF